MERNTEITEQMLRKMEADLKKKHPKKTITRIGNVGFAISKHNK